MRNFLSDFSSKNESLTSACLIELKSTHLIYPTFLQSNNLIKPFQEIIDTFSIPEYREINPACFAIVTFPFLFGVMFGDMGHGILLILLGFYLFIYRESIAVSKEAILKPLLELRFIILFFGFAAFYCGIMYNEFFSLPIPIFNTCFESLEQNNIYLENNFNYVNNTDIINITLGNYNNRDVDDKLIRRSKCVYPIGVDPTWNIGKNELNFINSLKMKLSVIIGVLHMMLGIVLSGVNFINKNQYSNIFTVFLPKFIFMGVLFGYLCVMIFLKWTTDWDAIQLVPPSLINQFLNIFLKGGNIVIINILNFLCKP